jgi:hypothetical protein
MFYLHLKVIANCQAVSFFVYWLGYGLENEKFVVRFPVGARHFFFPKRPNRLWDLPNLLLSKYQWRFVRS